MGGRSMRRFNGVATAGVVATLLASSSAMAGGFQRGAADTDILYEKGPFSSRWGMTYVNPNRGFSSVNGVEADHGTYTGIYTIPSLAVAFGNDDLACAGTYTIPFAAESDYDESPTGALPRQVSSPTSTSQTQALEFTSSEFGTTCRVSYSTENSRFSLLGGVFFEDFSFTGTSFGERNLNPVFQAGGAQGAGLVAALQGAQITLPTLIDVDTNGDYQMGFRIGAAYERPDIALRVQVLYRSEVKHDDIRGSGTVQISDTAFLTLPNGQQASIPTAFGGAVSSVLAARGLSAGTVLNVESSLSEAISPQSLTINAQTGIAAGTLLLGSFRWTDWSTNNDVVSTIYSPLLGSSSSSSPYNWDDGYTVSVGIGRAFNDEISGVINLGYDAGVSTGSETTYTDLYTVSGGLSLKPNKWSEIRFGGLIGYWTSGDQKISDGAYFDAHVDDTFVYAGNAAIKLSF